MHSAAVERSPRLQRVLALLRDGNEHSTRAIVQECDVCAVNAIVAELRDNGYPVECRQEVRPGGGRVWLYRLPRGQLALFEKSGDGLSALATPAGEPGPGTIDEATPPPPGAARGRGTCGRVRDEGG